MAKRKDKEKAPEKPPRRKFLGDRSAVLGTLTTIVTLAIIATLAASVVLARGPLLKQASRIRTTELRVAFDWPPLAGKATSRTAGGEPATWMNREQRDELERIALRLLSGDPFDGDSLERTRDALRQTGWFEQGPWLKRYESGLVVITGRWRTPIAAVRMGDIDRLVSAKGELLAPQYPAGRSGMKVLVNAGDPPDALGDSWPGGHVQAGLALLLFLSPMPGFDQVQAIDVGDFVADKRLSLVTTTGGRVLWGGSPGEFNPGQAPAAIKRERLASVYQQFGQIDAGRATLDLRSEDGVYLHEPIPEVRGATVRR